jgi:hypothetical protein
MRATQSSTASGNTSRPEQLAALRYTNQSLDSDFGAEGRRLEWQEVRGVTVGQVDLSRDAANLLAELSLYTELMTRPDLSWEEHEEYQRRLNLLTDQSRELVVSQFLRHSRTKHGLDGRLERADAATDAVAVWQGPL